MTAADISREARWAEENPEMVAWLKSVFDPRSRAKPHLSRFPAAVANHPAFTSRLDLKRLDIGLAAAMGKNRGVRG